MRAHHLIAECVSLSEYKAWLKYRKSVIMCVRAYVRACVRACMRACLHMYSPPSVYGWIGANCTFLGLSHIFFGVSCATAMFFIDSSCGNSNTSSALGKRALAFLSIGYYVTVIHMDHVNIFILPTYYFMWPSTRMLEWFLDTIFPAENVCGLFFAAVRRLSIFHALVVDGVAVCVYEMPWRRSPCLL